ncbi:MAG: helix-turn-helix transcriptional regulator [Lachnospiraceae bacterium]|nr:helix-turn-helix transcriptional regulator [Lachnospiraceae bacterium]MBR4058363.1 helix-turn-helix transcriptional regulator [Lachnospiraceae bacterium]
MYPIIDKRETGINIRRIMDQHKLTVKAVQQFLGLGSAQSIYHWLNGISLPTIDNLYALSELFQVPMDDLICGSRTMTKRDRQSSSVDNNIKRLHAYYEAYRRLAA